MHHVVSVVLAMLVGGSASAHHSRAIFADDVISFEGEVVRFDWANPHSYIYVRALDADGATVEWELETQSTPGLARLGWTKDSLKPGERVTVRARPHRDASLHSAFAQALIKEDGSVLAPIFASSSAANPAAEAQNLWGVWRVASARGRGFGGPNLSLPLTEKGRAAAARYDARDDPMTECIPQTTPASISNEYLHAIEQGSGNVLLRDEYWEVVRTVHMDGRAHPPADQRFQQGHSTGRWEGQTLVVETTNFTDNVWGLGIGVPSGAQKRVVERYRLTDGGTTLTIDFTLEDPEFLTAPISDSEKWRYMPGLELLPNKCDLEIAHRYLRRN
jgi:uncharacterized protein DUF6152